MSSYYNLSMLPSAVWHTILPYLSPADMRNLMLVNRQIKDCVKGYLYNELTLTEWASSGKRLALAIKQGVVSEETVSCIRTFRIKFTSFDEISETLQLCLDIQPRMSGVRKIEIEGHKTEDTILAVNILGQKFHDVSIQVTARAPGAGPLHPTFGEALNCITALRLPRLFRSDVAHLRAIEDLQVEEVINDESNAVLNSDRGMISRIAMRYNDFVMLGNPSCEQLDVMLDRSVSELRIESPSLRVLRLVATTDLPFIQPFLRIPCLTVMILCNIAPLPTIRILQSNNFENLEFLSLAPVTIPALQALATAQFIPTLRLVLAMVMHTSYLSDTANLQKRETRKLVEWLQTLASTYPVDVRDFSHLLKREIYFSEGLWCLAAQTRYCKYLPLVAPPPLIISD